MERYAFASCTVGVGTSQWNDPNQSIVSVCRVVGGILVAGKPVCGCGLGCRSYDVGHPQKSQDEYLIVCCFITCLRGGERVGRVAAY